MRLPHCPCSGDRWRVAISRDISGSVLRLFGESPSCRVLVELLCVFPSAELQTKEDVYCFSLAKALYCGPTPVTVGFYAPWGHCKNFLLQKMQSESWAGGLYRGVPGRDEEAVGLPISQLSQGGRDTQAASFVPSQITCTCCRGRRTIRKSSGRGKASAGALGGTCSRSSCS